MQIKSNFTREQLMEEHDILSHALNPIGKLRAMAELLSCVKNAEFCNGFVMRDGTMEAVENTISDACDEIEYLIDVSNERWRRDTKKWRTTDEK